MSRAHEPKPVRVCDDCETPLVWSGYALVCGYCGRYYHDTTKFNPQRMARDYLDDLRRSKQS